MSIESSRRTASAAFIVLLALSVLWPEPVVDINNLCCHATLGIDDLSFLGREAPSWDVAFWFVTGLFVIALLQRGGDFREVRIEARGVALRRSSWLLGLIGVCAMIVAALWRWADAPLMAISERLDSPRVETVIRYANRFGGGMNPVMIIGFFLLAGVVYRTRDWIWYAVAMAIAGAFAGIVVQIVKFAVGRTRPELWLGPFHHVRASATSFPSGHTVGAFALGGVLLFHARSRSLRIAAAILAIGVAVSRVLAFRHWPSDVTASAAIGLICAATLTRRPNSLPPAPQS